jgi:isoamylase
MGELPFQISNGTPHPFGVTSNNNQYNFAIVSSTAKTVSLCLFSNSKQNQPTIEIPLDPLYNKTGHVWHICLEYPEEQFLYSYRIDGNNKMLLDPYAKAVTTSYAWRECTTGTYQPFGAISHTNQFNWENDKPPSIAPENLIIYEMHIRGFTQHPSSAIQNPGTYEGVIEKIPYLLELGINAIELLPIYEFDETEYKRTSPLTKDQLCNYWGYSTVNFFSPMQRFSNKKNPEDIKNEFKKMVRELHKNGIEVILDVVYNHTAEGNHEGPTLSFKGFDNAEYYMLDDKGRYLNFSGCGNTFSCNNPIDQELILSSLRYWVVEMHIDGFRFDLASILTRGTHGAFLSNPPILELISKDPILSNVKLIAEPWDAGGLYQVGSFFPSGGKRWSEWNGRYRDIVRRFIKGTGHKGAFAANICGSQDLYYRESPNRSINFVTAHDGFTLADLVSYNQKHNIANGEDNRDGTDSNDSWNCGEEGETSSISVNALRQRQMRNFHVVLMLSRGIPMLHMGDEYGHTKLGNNNTWCQDNELNWFLWDKIAKNGDFFRFYKKLIHFRKERAVLRQDHFYSPKDIEWHGQRLKTPEWDKNNSFIAFTIKDHIQGQDIYAAFNMSGHFLNVELPHNQEYEWNWIVDTSKEAPYDFLENDTIENNDPVYRMTPYSSIILKARSKKA